MARNLALIAVVLLGAAGLVLLTGCGADHGDHGDHAHHAAPPAQPGAEGEAIAQTHCPVMGAPIDKDVYVDHEGRRVYFCCEPCVAQFQQNPEEYLAKLDEPGEPEAHEGHEHHHHQHH